MHEKFAVLVAPPARPAARGDRPRPGKSRDSGQARPADRLRGCTAVAASGLTPGKQVVWFGVEHAGRRRVLRRAGAALRGRHGWRRTARRASTSAAPPAPRSFWVAVDLDSGDVRRGRRPTATGSRQPQRSPRTWELGQGAKADELLDDRPYPDGPGGSSGPGRLVLRRRRRRPARRGRQERRPSALRARPVRSAPRAARRRRPSSRAHDLWFVIDPLAMEISMHKGGVAQ